VLSHSSLSIYYQKIFAMAQHHKYSITELESMLPYERDIYFDLLVDFIEKQKEEQRNKS
jgi:DNA replication initiation complex subunit (GINS family)